MAEVGPMLRLVGTTGWNPGSFGNQNGRVLKFASSDKGVLIHSQ